MFDFQIVINYFYFYFGITESITTFVRQLRHKNMTKINVTLPTGKAGQQRVFTIEFSILNFDQVIDEVSKIVSVIELKNSKLWKVI